VSGGNHFVTGAQARALGNHADASVGTAGEYPPSSAPLDARQRCSQQRCAADSPVTITGAYSASSDTFPASEHLDNVAFDRSNAPAAGPQFHVRAQSMRPVTGRPEAAEQERIAASVGALLQRLRAERRMSLRDLEGRSGVARSTISRVEWGLRRPRRSMLGWLAWGLDAENVVPLTLQLAEAAGDSLIADSRWSARTHARHAADALRRGTMPVPPILLASRAVDALGGVIPGELGRLRQLQEHAHELPWPPGMEGSPEVLAIIGELMDMPRGKLAAVGRAAVRVNDYQALQAQRRRERARKAAEREEFRRKSLYAARRRTPAGMP
jgi:transcriptional regulator with XRE-family HTH domain